MTRFSEKDCTLVSVGLIVGLTIAASALSLGWTCGQAAGVRHEQKAEQDWWEYSAKVDVLSRWEEAHRPPDKHDG